MAVSSLSLIVLCVIILAFGAALIGVVIVSGDQRSLRPSEQAWPSPSPS
jgi:hypothetical protein